VVFGSALLKVSTGREVSEADIRSYLDPKKDWDTSGFSLENPKVVEALNHFSGGVKFYSGSITRDNRLSFGVMAQKNTPFITVIETPYNPTMPFQTGHAIVIHGLANTGNPVNSMYTFYDSGYKTPQIIPFNEISSRLKDKTTADKPA
jgi:hypothetical protein